MGRPRGKQTSHIRVEKDLLVKKSVLFPQYTYNDIFKIGLSVVNGIEKTGKFIYGNVWKTNKKR